MLTQDQQVVLTESQHLLSVLTQDQHFGRPQLEDECAVLILVQGVLILVQGVLILVQGVLILVQGVLTESQQGC
jgi:hypothetical protein